MTDVWGALAQSLPAATTLTDVYTAGADKQGTVEVIACNRGSSTTIRISHAIGGAADTGAQYLIYDATLAAGETKVTTRFTVRAGDILRG
jgi:hypothetical protein